MAVAVAILGLGEAGSLIGSDLARAGAAVRGWDPRPEAEATGVSRSLEPTAAIAASEVVLSVNTASSCVDCAHSAVAALGPGQVYADLNAAGAKTKRELASVVAPTGALFADVALMAPVPGLGARTPMLASGPGAEAFCERMRPLGMTIELVGDEPGQAASRKLLRSVFMKGLAAASIEALAAAKAAGCEHWLRSEITKVLETADSALLERLESGSRRHAARRIHEVADASLLLRELGIEPRVSDASGGVLKELLR